MTNAARTTDRVRTRWRAKEMSGSFRQKLPRRTDRHHSIQIVGQNTESDPRIGPIPTPQATTSPLVLATTQANRRLLATPPVLLPPEPPLAFMRYPSGTESSFIGQADLRHLCLPQECFVVLTSKPAIRGDDAGSPHDGLRMPLQRRGQQTAIVRVPHVHLVMRDHAIFRFRQQRLVA